jgi:O-antigen/teichoic acid export membrane protein
VQKGTKSYFAASVVSQIAALLRFVILSRMVGPAELGLVTLLILTSQFFELVTDSASDRFIVQDSDGDSPQLQKVVQAAMFARGVIIAVGMLVSAPFVAHAFNAPELALSLMVMAITPLIGGLVHMDVYRAQRANEFGPASILIASSEIGGLIGTAVAAFIVHDHTAILYGLILRAITLVGVSHILATRPYAWGFSNAEAKRFIHFAVPLFLNGLLLFLGTQGDRILVGGIGKAELGRYSASNLLIFYPTAIALRFLVNIHLPGMAASRDEPQPFYQAVEKLAGRTALLSIAMAIGFTLVGPFAAPLLFGKAFQQLPIVFALLAVLQTVRTVRLWPSTMALALGRSALAAADNAARLIALPVAFLVNQQHPGIISILAGFVLGEITALVVTMLLVNRAAHISNRSGAIRVTLYVAVCAFLIAGSWAVQANAQLGLAAAALGGTVALAALLQKERTVLAEVTEASLHVLARFGRRGFKGEPGGGTAA